MALLQAVRWLFAVLLAAAFGLVLLVLTQADRPAITLPPLRERPYITGFGAANHDAFTSVVGIHDGSSGSVRLLLEAAQRDGTQVLIDEGVALTVDREVTLATDTQLIGLGTGATITGTYPGPVVAIRGGNVRVRNLTLHASSDPAAASLRIQGGTATDYWVDHVTIESDTPPAEADDSSEGIEIWGWSPRPTADDSPGDGTLSSILFKSDYPLSKALLVGSSTGGDGARWTRVTVVDSVSYAWQRSPLVKNGATVHLINFVLPSADRIYGIGAVAGAQVVSEGGVFWPSTDTSTERWEANANASGSHADTSAILKVPTSGPRANLLFDGARVQEQDPSAAFDPHQSYQYEVRPPSRNLALQVIKAAGRGGIRVSR